MRRAALRKHNLEKMAALKARYSRLLAQVEQCRQRLHALGLSVTAEFPSLEAVERKYSPLLDKQKDVEVVREFTSEVESLASFAADLKARLEERLAELENRSLHLARDREILVSMRAEIRQQLDPGNASAEALAQRLASIQIPAVPVFRRTAAGLEDLESAESSILRCREDLQAMRADVTAAQTAALPQLAPSARRVRTVRDVLPAPKQSHGSPRSALLEELVSDARQGIRALGRFDSPRAERMIEALAAALDESNLDRRRTMLESLVINAPAQIRQAEERQHWREEIQGWIDSAAAFSSMAVKQVVDRLQQVRESPEIQDISALKQELDGAIRSEQAREEREDKRRAVLESLRELGYETNENLQTALVQGGRLVFQSPHSEDYGLEIVADQALGNVQTALVRFSGDSALSEEDRRRDIEHEEQWCQDHARLRQKIGEHGFEVNLKAQKKPGEHPVKIVVDAQRRRTSKTSQPRARSK